MQESVEGDPCKFVLWSWGSAERFTLQAASPAIKQLWTAHITELLDTQSNFLSGEPPQVKVHAQVKVGKLYDLSK